MTKYQKEEEASHTIHHHQQSYQATDTSFPSLPASTGARATIAPHKVYAATHHAGRESCRSKAEAMASRLDSASFPSLERNAPRWIYSSEGVKVESTWSDRQNGYKWPECNQKYVRCRPNRA